MCAPNPTQVVPPQDGQRPDYWLEKRYIDELSLQFRTAWDIYIKWYTVFLTANVVGIGAVAQYVPTNRGYIVLAFVIQNVLACSTAFGMAHYSHTTSKRVLKIFESFNNPNPLSFSPLPGELGCWSGIANAIGNLSLIACWIGLYFWKK